jgi:alpha-tubulin suppressor-like RCC1 family protein
VKVPGLTGIGSLAAGGATVYALPTAGGVLAWGANDTGQLGAGVVGGYAAVPVAVTGLTGVRSVAAGLGFALALRTDGTVASWGENDRGQLGQGASGPAAGAPQSVPGLTGVTAIGAGGRNGYAIVG